MKFCEKCGKELMDEAVICPSCGCSVSNTSKAIEKGPSNKAGMCFGIIGIVCAFLFAIVGHICSITAIIFGIKDLNEKKNSTVLTIGIIGEVCSIISSIIGAMILS